MSAHPEKPLPAWFPFNPDAPRWLILLLAALVGAGVGVVGIAIMEVGPVALDALADAGW